MMGTDLLIQKLQRDLNCLSDPDRSTRRRALERLQKRLVSGDAGEDAPSPDTVLQVAWDDVILRLVVRNLSDSVEKCRELAIQLISSVAKLLPKVDQTVLQILPVMAERMAQNPVLEESEEIRLQLVNLFVTTLLPQCSPEVCYDAKDLFFKIVIATVADEFHEVKKGGCQVIVLLGERAPKAIKEETEPLVKALLLNMNHSHFRVRMGMLQAVDAVVQIGLPAGAVSEHLAPGVKPLAFDRSTGLRAQLFTSVARWLGWEEKTLKENHTSIRRERDPRPYMPHLLPILLVGVSDESKAVASDALSLVEGVGRVCQEYMAPPHPEADKVMADAVEDMSLESSLGGRDSSMKENMEREDFTDGKRDMYADFSLSPPYSGRPGSGCRLMVQAFVSKLLPPALKDLGGWISVLRMGAARLIHTLLILAEDHATDHLEVLIPAFTSAVGDDEVEVAQQIIAAVQVLGFHTKAEYCLPLVLDIVTNPSANDAQRANGLVIMAGLLFGTPKRRIEEELVMKLNAGLSEEMVRCSDHAAVRRQLLAVLSNLLHVAGDLCKSSSLEMFLTLLQLQSADEDVQLQQAASQLAGDLAKAVGLSSVQDLYVEHVDSLIPVVTTGYEEWSGSSPAKALFHTFMKKSGTAVGPYLSKILNMFESCVHEGRDPSLRISTLQLVDDVFENEELGPWWSLFTEHIILELLTPCAVWRIGKVAASIRHKSMVALGTYLRRDLCSQGQLLEVLKSEKGVLGVVVSCLDEDYFVDTRRVTCHVIQHVIRIAGSEMEVSQRKTVSTELQKRLDDSSDIVRLGILPAIATFFETMPTSYSDEAAKSFLSTLLVHMDDTNRQIQEAVFLASQACATRRPHIASEVAASFRSRHRSTAYCDQLIGFASSIESDSVET